MSLLEHIQHLAETIGPRGSTTETEAKAADYIESHLSGIGFTPNRQQFLSATSAYSPYIVATGGALISFFLFWQPQPVGAAGAFVITLVVILSVLRELSFQTNPLRWVVPTEFSQNVSVNIPRVPGRDAALPPVLITTHMDSHRTPLLFSSPTWRRVFHMLMPIGLGCIVVLLVLFLIGIVSDARILRQIALVPGVVILALFVLLVQATRSPFSPGANDNASGVAVVLELAERLRANPLNKRDIVLAFTGCEEVGGYGIEAFIQAHKSHLNNAIHLVIDHVGGTASIDNEGPCVIRSEKFFRRVESDPALVALAGDVIRAQPDLHARSQHFDLAYSELTIGAKHDLRVIGIMGLSRTGTLPNWHVPGDVVANINEHTLQRAADFSWQLLRAIDEKDSEAVA